MHRHTASISLATLCLWAGFCRADLSPTEATIAAAAQKRAPAAEALLERAVNIQSPTENVAGVRAVGDLFAAELARLGMQTRWIDMPAGMHRAGHLVATTNGSKGKRVLMLGHMDTVLSGEPFRREGNIAHGTGSDDMKGGIVVMLLALQAMADAGVLADSRVTVMLTGDEEDVGVPLETSRGPMLELARNSDVLLGFEAAYEGTATIGRRGAGSWTLQTTGETGHSSQIFGTVMGDGAIYEAARILEAFRKELGTERYLTINPSVIVGGTTANMNDIAGSAAGKTNVIAPTAIVRGDIRFISIEQERSARERMQAIVARNAPRTGATLVFHESYPAMTPTPGNEALLAQLDAASRDLGQGPVEALDPGKRGAGDIGFVSHLAPGLDGLGSAGGKNAHAPGEYTDIASLLPMARRTAILLHRLGR
jgi:glutamate carboxypeptidase